MKKFLVSFVLVLAVSVSAVAQQVSRKSVAEDLIEMSLYSLEFPVDYGNANLMKTVITENAVESYYLCKTEEIYNAALTSFGQLRDNVLASFKEMAASNALISLFLYIDANKDIIYHYGSPSGRSFNMSITKNDLLQLIGIREVTPGLREDALKLLIGEISLGEIEDEFIVDKINKKTVSYFHRSNGCFVDNPNFNVSKETLLGLIERTPDAVFPLYSLYLGKGYKYVLEDPTIKKKQKIDLNYKELTFLYAYANDERQKFLEEQAAREAMAAQAAKEAEGSDVADGANGEEGVPFQLIDKKPLFQGGDSNEFSRWVNERLVYPDVAKEYGVQGRVTLQFTVEKDGRVSRVKVLRGLAGPNSEMELETLYKELKNATTEQDINLIKANIGELKGKMALDKEAVRVVSMSPKWLPGMLNDKPVPVTYTFPVIFQLR